jgi:hypothetical protein
VSAPEATKFARPYWNFTMGFLKVMGAVLATGVIGAAAWAAYTFIKFG